MNYNVYPTKWFKTGLNLGVTRTVSNYSTSDSGNSSSYSNLTRFIRTMAPIYPVHKHDLETGAYLELMVRQLLIRVNIFMIMKELACRIMDVMR